MIATNAIAKTLQALEVRKAVPWVRLSRARPSRQRQTVLVSLLAELTPETANRMRAIAGAKGRYLVFAGTLPFEAVSERLATLGIRDPERLHIAHERGDEARSILIRLAVTLAESDTDRILDAWWEEEQLVVLSNRFRRLHVPLRDLLTVPGLARVRRRRLEELEVHPDGAYLRWPSVDVHMGWDQFERIVNPDFRKQRGAEFHKRYGEAIRRLRKASGLRQVDVAGLTARHLRRIERGEQPATHSALVQLAKAHRMRVAQYVAALARGAS